jgi:succinate dehydrogenase/fumarate reductase flavoprotein subunit
LVSIRTAAKNLEVVSCDVMVIGGGGAGLRAAIAAKSDNAKKVIVVSKSKIGYACNTYLSKAIVAASGQTESADNARAHWADTLEGGRYLNNEAIVARMTERIPSEISFLADCGVPFSRDGDRLQVLKIPGHQCARHVFGARWKGRDLVLPLRHYARQKGVEFFEHVFVTRLFAAENHISGAAGIAADGRMLAFQAQAIILTTGGYGQIFLNTNNAPGITGDGHALAYALGVPLKDMEFVQFYPTALGRRGGRLFLNEKLLAQAGVTLENVHGEDLFQRGGYADPLSVNRDRLAQLVFREIGAQQTEDRHVVMNLSGLSDETAAQLTQLLPSSWLKGERKFNVAPTAHYCMGGIETDDGCRTAVTGLFVAGEAAAGCHGANRLGGNSLAEIFSMGAIAGENAAGQTRSVPAGGSLRHMAAEEGRRLDRMFVKNGDSPKRFIRELKKIMWYNAGIVRDKMHLQSALAVLEGPWPGVSVSSYSDLRKMLEFENMRLVSEMVCRAALLREESRGSHFRQDFPQEDDANWRNNIQVRRGAAGMVVMAQSLLSMR